MSTNLKFRPTPTGMAPRLCFLPLVMLSGVGANATTQSKHPGAVGCDKVDTGSSTEAAVLTFPTVRDGVYYKFWVYILSSRTGTLYVGITGYLDRRIHQHKIDTIKGFTKKYQVHRLVYFESYDQVENAINREKQLKGWRRQKKKALIETTNPRWQDVAEQWGREMRFQGQSLGRTP
jgi:putative endonuclease